MAGKSIHSREISQIVESQMRQWELTRSEETRRQSRAHLAESGDVVIDYIALSRSLGSGGTRIAQMLSDLLEWQLFDKEILDYMAHNLDVHKSVLESVDERTIGWIEDWLAPLFTGRAVRQLEYYQHLVRVLLVIARHGQAVILGRAAGLVLPRDRGLSVRIVAPFELRCRRYSERNDLSDKKAENKVARSDREQKEFVRGFLSQDIGDCQHYDIVVNTDKISPQSAAKLVWRTLDQRKKG